MDWAQHSKYVKLGFTLAIGHADMKLACKTRKAWLKKVYVMDGSMSVQINLLLKWPQIN